ncbi:bifunctional 5,10-methylenetetrahydrofolate dehydrogenase/5,10-methenyltetrahydrofolate cyclohydrolase [Nocardia aobensis]|uniref:Bifunctional protein FolD n=1 Tax=Nocardia aobensis TaxID=257277 RepID=A0ABW6PF25_9NOCA
MVAQIIDGRAHARSLITAVKADIALLQAEKTNIGLATITVGTDYGSVAYENRLRALAHKLGIPYEGYRLDESTSEADLINLVRKLNAEPDVSGILALRPLPAHIDEASIFKHLDPRKDIESVHPENAGLLALGVPRFVPSTAAAAFYLLDSWIDSTGANRADFYHGANIVVIGRSNNVGKPAVSLGFARGAAVASIDEWADRTTGVGRHTRRADVLIVAAGKAGLVKAEHVTENTVVIDVGINPMTDLDGRVRMVGDVDFEPVAARARAITPVPGGVGPITDVWLMSNTVSAARLLAVPSHTNPEFTEPLSEAS